MFEHRNTFDFKVIDYEGQRALSLIDPQDEHKGGVILDNAYEIQHTVDLRGDLENTNMHDFTVVDNGTHALTLTKVPGGSSEEESEAVGFEGECKAGWEGFKEVDVVTSEVIFDWSPHGHIGLDEVTKNAENSDERCSKSWDILHLNSIDKFADGDYLVSSRHTDTVYKISHEDGSIVWRLGGVKSDFKIDRSTNFTRQHHARVRGENATHALISLFDNARGDGEGETTSNRNSRGMLLRVNTEDPNHKTVSLVRKYDHPNGGITNSRGSLQYLPNGNAFLGWTYGSLLSEHAFGGKLLMKAHFKLGNAHTYRAYKFRWTGRPSEPPTVHGLVMRKFWHTETVVHMSWNGATEVDSWRVYRTNADDTEPTFIASMDRQGFESAMMFETDSQFLVAEAYDADGNQLGRSKATQTEWQATPLLTTLIQPIPLAIFGAALSISCFFCVRFVRRSDRFVIPRRKPQGPQYEMLAKGDVEDDEWSDSETLNGQMENDKDERVTR